VWAAKQQTSTVPIVVAFSGDFVATGIVSNLARPGGNITGVSFMSTDLAAKRLELLKEAFPRLARVAFLYDPEEVASLPELQETRSAARTLGVMLQPIEVGHADDLERLFAAASGEPIDALLVSTQAFALRNRDRIIEAAAHRRWTTMYGLREFVESGGLISHGPDIFVVVRRAADYVDRILKGASAGDMPIEQPTRFYPSINLKTAASLGVTIPKALLLRANELME
jgi:putative ABC transport system substrate-binding protein